MHFYIYRQQLEPLETHVDGNQAPTVQDGEARDGPVLPRRQGELAPLEHPTAAMWEHCRACLESVMGLLGLQALAPVAGRGEDATAGLPLTQP